MRGATCFENWAWEDTPLLIIFETGFLEELRGTRENSLIKSDLFLICYGVRWPFQGEEEQSWWRRKAYFSQPSQAPEDLGDSHHTNSGAKRPAATFRHDFFLFFIQEIGNPHALDFPNWLQGHFMLMFVRFPRDTWLSTLNFRHGGSIMLAAS